jgi:hypothetical protein
VVILLKVRYAILLFTAVVLFSSCNLTKRRYMPGYSVNWGHKNPKKISTKEAVTTRNSILPQLQPIAPKELSIITAPAEKWTVPNRLKPIPVFHTKSISYNHITANSKVTIPIYSGPAKVDKGQPQFFTGDEQEDDHARKSLVYGILSLGLPAIGFLIMLGIVLSVGSTLANPVTYAVIIFIAGCAGGLIFALFAIINGFLAIKEINSEPDTYNGTGDAVLGMILAALVPIGIAAYLLVRFL